MNAVRSRTAPVYWVLCLLILPVAMLELSSKPWGETADLWEQAAAIRAVAHNAAHPANPLLALPGETSPRFTPYTVLWGLVLKVTRMNLFALLVIIGLANFVLFVTGFARLMMLEFENPRLPLIGLLVMLVVWGRGYGQSNAYQLRMFFYTLPYIATFAYGICFHALAFLKRFVERSRWQDAAAYAILMVIAFLSHPITATFAFVAAAAMMLADNARTKLLWMQAVPVLCLAGAVMWPYFDYTHVLLNGSMESWFTSPHFKGQISSLGPALAGIPILVVYAATRRYLFVVYGFLFCAAVYVIAAIVHSEIGGRFIFFGTIFLHMAIALFIANAWPVWWHRLSHAWPSTKAALAVCAVILAVGLFFRVRDARALADDFGLTGRADTESETPAARLAFLNDLVGGNQIVLSDEKLGLILPVVTEAKVVAHAHGSPIITHELQRRCIDSHRFFYSPLLLAERKDILRRYGATQIVFDSSFQSQTDPSFLADIGQLAVKRATRGDVSLYDVR